MSELPLDNDERHAHVRHPRLKTEATSLKLSLRSPAIYFGAQGYDPALKPATSARAIERSALQRERLDACLT